MLNKTPMYHSNKYDNAPMPFAQFFDPTGLRCMRATIRAIPPATAASVLPSAFAKKLYSVTDIGTPVYHRRVAAEGRAANWRGPSPSSPNPR